MSITLKILGGWCLVFMLSVTSYADSNDLRLVQAARNGDHETIRSLLRSHVDVNTPQADGATALSWASYNDDLETADLLIRAGANVNAANSDRVPPLSLACRNGSATMVEKLLQAGANPNAALPTGEVPLMTVARTGNVEAVTSLLAHGADVNAKENERGQTALMWAAAEGHPEVVRALIEHGADIHARSKGGFSPLLFAAQQGDMDSARILLAAGANVSEATQEDGSALVVASASGHEALAMFLLDKGADPNVADGNGITSLHYAILKGISLLETCRWELPIDHPVYSYLFRPNMRELVRALLAHGANPNARIVKDPLLPVSQRVAMSPVGATPFLLAAATDDANLMRILAASGADPLLATKDHTTPLIMAAGFGAKMSKLPSYRRPRTEEEDRSALEAVKLAVEMGDDVNAANDIGVTPLHSAAYVGADAIVEFLVDKGAKLDAVDKNGQTPFTIAAGIHPPTLHLNDVAPAFAHKSTADLLRRLGATALAPPEGQVTNTLPATR